VGSVVWFFITFEITTSALEKVVMTAKHEIMAT
jgi:hypothetical protein